MNPFKPFTEEVGKGNMTGQEIAASKLFDTQKVEWGGRT